jgi:hypothetical protein
MAVVLPAPPNELIPVVISSDEPGLAGTEVEQQGFVGILHTAGPAHVGVPLIYFDD